MQQVDNSASESKDYKICNRNNKIMVYKRSYVLFYCSSFIGYPFTIKILSILIFKKKTKKT